MSFSYFSGKANSGWRLCSSSSSRLCIHLPLFSKQCASSPPPSYLHPNPPKSPPHQLIKPNLRPRLRSIPHILDERPIRLMRLLLDRGPELQQVVWDLLPRGAEHVD